MKMKIRIQIQTVFCKERIQYLNRFVLSLSQSIRYAKNRGIDLDVWYRLGFDSSITSVDIDNIKRDKDVQIEHVSFDRRISMAEGHNLLAANSNADYLLIISPDVVTETGFFEELLNPLKSDLDRSIGILEPRQTPIELRKAYDPITGETSWASQICSLVRTDIFCNLHGFDTETFSSYYNDIDFSWRTRMAGYRIIFRPNAIVFHVRQVTYKGDISLTNREYLDMIEAKILLAWKWSFTDHVQKYLKEIEKTKLADYKHILERIRTRKEKGTLPGQLDFKHLYGQFLGFQADFSDYYMI